MTHKHPATRFVVTLEVPAETDAVRVLRGALKVLLRRFGLKCTSVRELTPRSEAAK
jgi:hypothetical protein